MHRADVVDGGLRSLDWLMSLQLSPEGEFAPIGCNGFLARGGAAAAFDQQPVEAGTMTSSPATTCLPSSRTAAPSCAPHLSFSTVHAVGGMAVGSQWRETDHRAAQLPHA